VNFQSFNSYLAGSVGCTTYSFAVNLGCYLTYIPYEWGQDRLKQKDGRLLPKEFQCHLRSKLHKTIPQPEFQRKDIWFIDDDGKFLGPAVFDAANIIANDGLPWFDRFASDSEVLRTLLRDRETHGGTWGFGANPSPHRSYLIGYVALFLKRFDLAATQLKRALDSGCFSNVEEQIRRDLQAVAGS